MQVLEHKKNQIKQKYFFENMQYIIHSRAYGVPLSMRNRNKLRLLQGFESHNDAHKRTEENKIKIRQVPFLYILGTIPQRNKFDFPFQHIFS